MNDYFSRLDAAIKTPDDIGKCAALLTEISQNRAWISRRLAEFFDLASESPAAAAKSVSGNAFSLSGMVEASRDAPYFLGMSLHQAGLADSIVNHSICSILTPLNATVLVHRYAMPDGWNPEVFNPSLQLQFEETITLREGEVLEISPSRICYHFEFREPTVLIKLQSRVTLVPLEWSFDAKSKTAWQSIAIEPGDSYLQHLCIAAKTIRDPEFIDPLKTLLRSDRHFIRWGAAQALGAISAELGLEALRTLAQDPHPSIGATARKILFQAEQGAM